MMELLTVFWGPKHLDVFKRGLLRSLNLPQNKEAISCSPWNVFTDQPRELLGDLPANAVVRDLSNLRTYTDPIQAALVWQINECLVKKSKLLLAPPDTIFGDGSIENLVKLSRNHGDCVLSPHPRVLPSILDKALPSSRSELVTLAWEHLHKSWTHAEQGHKENSSFIGGVTWQRLDSSIAVTHLLPTVYLADFLPEDLEYFKTAISFGDWDHTWAIKLLGFDTNGRMTLPNRVRYAASSDIAFICEVTDADKNIPSYHHDHPKDGSFWKDHAHNRINRGIIATFR